MEFRKVLALRGPNIWANFPVFEAWVDLGISTSPSTDFPGFNDRLMAWLPTMIEHRCSIGERGGFFQRLRDGTYPGHILEHVTLELQTLAGTEVGFGRARETSEAGVYKVVIEYHEETVATGVPDTSARELLSGGDPRSALRRDGRSRAAAGILPKDAVSGRAPARSSTAAQARGIPFRRLNADSLVQLGYGREAAAHPGRRDRPHRRHRRGDRPGQGTDAHACCRPSACPCPEGRPVKDADDAWAAAEEIGVPVVVKPQRRQPGPRRGHQPHHPRAGRGGLRRRPRQESKSVIVEKFAPGHDYRLLVVGERVVAAARREPAQVSATASTRSPNWSSMRQPRSAPRRASCHRAEQDQARRRRPWPCWPSKGYTPESVPPAGHRGPHSPQRAT